MGYIFAVIVCALLLFGDGLIKVLCVLLPIAVAVLFFCFYLPKKVQPATSSSAIVNDDYVNEAVLFFNNYLSLSELHHATGHAYLTCDKKDEFGFHTKIGCSLFSIDDTHASDALSIISFWHKETIEQNMQNYIGCDNIHYIFSEPDEYRFGDPDVTIEFDRFFFFSKGDWSSSKKAIKDELLKLWPNAKIDIFKNGIIVK